MYRAALRSSSRGLRGLQQTSLPTAARRPLTTSSASAGRRTWKSTGLRWGLAVAAVYWYSTSPIFADEPAPRTGPAPPQFSESDLRTVDAVIEEKRRQTQASSPPPPPSSDQPQAGDVAPAEQTAAKPVGEDEPSQGSPEALEEEAGQQGAFDPETGEINWECPCLGGMAHGPCGEEFKAAFSCFVYSQEEPKGMECIDKFQHMRDCFREHPDIYGSELDDDDDDGEAAPAPAAGSESPRSTDNDDPEQSKEKLVGASPKPDAEVSPAKPPVVDESEITQQLREAKNEAKTAIPTEAFDTTDANQGKGESSSGN